MGAGKELFYNLHLDFIIYVLLFALSHAYSFLYPSTNPSYVLMDFKVSCGHRYTLPLNTSACMSLT